MKKQNGFTLIELVVVIAILGILAAVALPRFMNATKDAHRAAVAGTAGALGSAVALVRAQGSIPTINGTDPDYVPTKTNTVCTFTHQRDGGDDFITYDSTTGQVAYTFN